MNKQHIIKLISAYISVILGAGFISGKELYFFFGKYSMVGILTLLIVCILFSLLFYKQLTIILLHNFSDYHEFSLYVMPKKIVKAIENITLLFLFVMIATMISAFCLSITESFSINIHIVRLIIFIITIYFLITGIDNVVYINSILTPIMIFGTLIVGIFIYLTNTTQTFYQFNYTQKSITMIKPFFYCILYVSFNSLTTIPMISNMKNIIDSKKSIFISSLISGIILFMLGFSILYPMILNDNIIKNSDIPIITLLNDKNLLIEYLYLVILLCAILSTLLSTSISFISAIEAKFKITKNTVTVKIITVFFAILLSTFGFSSFISLVYPIFGILGLVQIYYILAK